MVLNLSSSVLILITLTTGADGNDWPVILRRVGDKALLPCIPRGESPAYFWHKGEWFNKSLQIAYKIQDLPAYVMNKRDDKYTLFKNGTLMISNVTREDEDGYFCRIVSETSDCYAGVAVLLKVELNDFSLTIDGCNPHSVCIKYFQPQSLFNLSCTADFVPPSTVLRWFNGTKELTENSFDGKKKHNQDNTMTISKHIVLRNTRSSILTCEASGVSTATKSKHMIAISSEDELSDSKSSSLSVITVFLVFLCVSLLFLCTCVGIMCYRGYKANTKAQEGSNTSPDEEKGSTEEGQKLLNETATDGRTISPKKGRSCNVETDTIKLLKERITTLTVEKREQTKNFRSQIDQMPGKIKAAQESSEIFQVLRALGDWIHQIQQLQEKLQGFEHLNDDIQKMICTFDGETGQPPREKEMDKDMPFRISGEIKAALKMKVDSLSSEIYQSEEKAEVQTVLRKMAQWFTGMKDHSVSKIPWIKEMTIDALNPALKRKFFDLSEKVTNSNEIGEIRKVVREFGTWQTVIQDHKQCVSLPETLVNGMLTDMTGIQNTIKDDKSNFPGVEEFPQQFLQDALNERMSKISKALLSSKTQEDKEKVLKEVSDWHSVLGNPQSAFLEYKSLPVQTLDTGLKKKMSDYRTQVGKAEKLDEIEKVLKDIAGWHTVMQSYQPIFSGVDENFLKKIKDALDEKMTTISKNIKTSQEKDDIRKTLTQVKAWNDGLAIFPEYGDRPPQKIKDALDEKMGTISKNIKTSQEKDAIKKILTQVKAWNDGLAIFPEYEDPLPQKIKDALNEKMRTISKNIKTSQEKDAIKKTLTEVKAWNDGLAVFPEYGDQSLQKIKDALDEKMTTISKNIKTSQKKDDIRKTMTQVKAWNDGLAIFPEYGDRPPQKIKDALDEKMRTISENIKASQEKEEIKKVLTEVNKWNDGLAVFPEYGDRPPQKIKDALDDKMKTIAENIKTSQGKEAIEQVMREVKEWNDGLAVFLEKGDLPSKKIKDALNDKMKTIAEDIKTSQGKEAIEQAISRLEEWQNAIENHMSTIPWLESFQKDLKKRKDELSSKLEGLLPNTP